MSARSAAATSTCTSSGARAKFPDTSARAGPPSGPTGRRTSRARPSSPSAPWSPPPSTGSAWARRSRDGIPRRRRLGGRPVRARPVDRGERDRRPDVRLLLRPPRYTFAVADTRYVVTFAVMLAIGLLISTLTSRLKAQVDQRQAAGAPHLGPLRARQATQLPLGRRVPGGGGGPQGRRTLRRGGRHLPRRSAGEDPEVAFGQKTSIAIHPVSEPAAHWVIEHDQIAGAGTDTLPNAVALFLPLVASQRTRRGAGRQDRPDRPPAGARPAATAGGLLRPARPGPGAGPDVDGRLRGAGPGRRPSRSAAPC